MSPVGNHNPILAYTHVPTSAFRIPEPDLSSPPPNPHDPRHSFSAGSDGPRTRSRLASFPPNNAGVAPKRGTNPGGKGDALGGTGSGGGGLGSALSSGVTDMFISHLLPSTLPSKAVPQATLPVPGKVRALSSQRESLSLPVMTSSFRRFVARCGTIFWVEDRVEEVLYWRKPVWTLSWMLLWGFICEYRSGFRHRASSKAHFVSLLRLLPEDLAVDPILRHHPHPTTSTHQDTPHPARYHTPTYLPCGRPRSQILAAQQRTDQQHRRDLDAEQRSERQPQGEGGCRSSSWIWWEGGGQVRGGRVCSGCGRQGDTRRLWGSTGERSGLLHEPPRDPEFHGTLVSCCLSPFRVSAEVLC